MPLIPQGKFANIPARRHLKRNTTSKKRLWRNHVPVSQLVYNAGPSAAGIPGKDVRSTKKTGLHKKKLEENNIVHIYIYQKCVMKKFPERKNTFT
jgi:hypothetical protein